MVDGLLNNYMKKIIFFNLIIFSIIVISCEIFLKSFKISQLMGIDSKILTFKDGIHFLTPNSSGLVFSKRVFIDKNGNRVPKEEIKINQNENIIIIGDSVAFGNGVVEKDTFVGLMRTQLKSYNFINTSVPGYDLLHHEKNLEKIEKYNNIKKIIYFLTLNDVLRAPTIVPWNNRNQQKLEQELGFLQKIIQNKYLRNFNYYLRNKSYIFMYLKGVLTDPSSRWYTNIKIFYKENEINYLSDYLKKLRSISVQKNAELSIVILPYEYQTRFCSDKNKLIPQTLLVKQIKSLEINYFDFYKDFCKYKKPKNLFYKFDPMHLSKIGHKQVKELIINEIKF
jgi:hypothetical protein